MVINREQKEMCDDARAEIYQFAVDFIRENILEVLPKDIDELNNDEYDRIIDEKSDECFDYITRELKKDINKWKF